MTVRGSRLAAPAFGAAALGALVILLAPFEYFQLVGGLVSAGLYTAALQLVLGCFLLVVIDDFRDPEGLLETAREDRRSGKSSTDAIFSTRRTLIRFYLRKPGPALCLGFGLATTTSTIAIGLLDSSPIHLFSSAPYPSELLLAGITAVTALPQLVKRGTGYFGWCWGMAAGASLTQLQLGVTNDRDATLLGWACAGALFCLFGAVVKGGIILAGRNPRHNGGH
jgi:hypothetical protein